MKARDLTPSQIARRQRKANRRAGHAASKALNKKLAEENNGFLAGGVLAPQSYLGEKEGGCELVIPLDNGTRVWTSREFDLSAKIISPLPEGLIINGMKKGSDYEGCL